MRGDFFDFKPKFKLLVMGNRKPSLQGVDEAWRRRMHLIPFTVIIPPAERDKLLTQKLEAEWPGIMQWCIDGCLEWQRTGLNPPKAVTVATKSYLASEDNLGNWLQDCCTPSADAWEPSAAMFASWKRWCDEHGEKAGAAKSFAQAMEGAGAMPKRRKDGRGFEGYQLKG
jgi:putative DNA primase/helicase